jgi:hypothetical protein
MTDLEALVVAAYVFADEYPVPARCGRPPATTDAELVALAVCQAAIGISSDRQFLGLVERVLPGWFPQLPSQSQYKRRLRGLVELISIVQQRLARWLRASDVARRGGGVRARIHGLTRTSGPAAVSATDRAPRTTGGQPLAEAEGDVLERPLDTCLVARMKRVITGGSRP